MAGYASNQGDKAGETVRARYGSLSTDGDDSTETTRLLDPVPIDDDDDYDVDARAGGADASSTQSWDGLRDFEHLPWWRTPSVYWLLGPFAIFTLAFGGIMVPRLNLILSLVCKQHFADKKLRDPSFEFNPILLGSDNPQCKTPEVQAAAATFMLVMNLFTGGLSAIVAPKLGQMSDRYGRTRILALASVGGVMGELVTIMAGKFPDVIDYRWLILGGIFDGMAGSFTTGNIMTQSYTSDCTPPSKRAVSMGYIHACLFTGLALGPLIAGYIVQWTGNLMSIFYVAIACHTFFVLIMFFLVPESLSKRRQLIAREQHQKDQELQAQNHNSWYYTLLTANPFAPLAILWPTGPGTSPALRRNLVALAACDTIVLGSGISAGAVIVLYAGAQFDWNTLQTSQFISVLSTVRVFALMAVFPVINYFGRTLPAARRRRAGIVESEKNAGADSLDIWVVRMALVSDLLGATGYIVSRSQGLFFASGMVTAFGGLGSATSQAMITKHVPAERVGQILGAIGMLHALCRVLGPAAFNGLYALTVGKFSQAIFVMLGSFFAVALIASLVVRPHVFWKTVSEAGDEGETEPLNPEPVDEEDQVRL